MKYRLLFVFLLVLPMLFSAGATAQSVVVSNLGLKDTAIVRPFGEEYALTYSDNAFVLCNGHDHTALAFNVPFIVRDVEIWNDETAYFCGEYGGRGVMGCFDILPTFAGSAPVNYAVTMFSATNPGLINCTTDVTGIKRLALFWDAQRNSVALAMVCDEVLKGPEWNRTAVMGAYFSPAGIWPTSVLYNKDGLKVYHDIETLKDLVVATMTDTNIEGCYTRAFKNTNYNFPAYPCITHSSDRILLNTPMGPPQITRLKENSAAVVQYNDKPGMMVHFLDFNVTTGHPTAACPSSQNDISLPPYHYNTGMWWFNGVRYLEDTLYVLGSMNYPGETGFEKWLFEMPNTGTATSALMHRFVKSEPYSMDVDGLTQRPASAGKFMRDNNLDWDVYVPQIPSGCQERLEINVTRQQPSIVADGADGDGVFADQNNIQFFPIIRVIDLQKVCSNRMIQE